MSSRIVEVVLSSTSAGSPLPLTSVHSVETGQLILSLKSPPPPATTTSTTANAHKGKQSDEHITSAKTMSFVPAANGVANSLLGLGGKDGRALLNAWNFTRESTVARLIPPVRLSTIATSPDGVYLVGGTLDGRIFLWELSSGILLATLDAHYRAITCLEFTRDASCLISASEDAGISVWSVGRILNSTPMNPPTPFTTLSDHTLGITSIVPGHLGSFPNSRVFSSSRDGTVKIWDLSTSPASLLTTFQFPAPVQHLVVDPLERFFFASIPTTTSSNSSTDGPGGGEPSTATGPATNGSKVLRVNLYRTSTDSRNGGVVAVGGTGSIGELERVDAASSESGMSYALSEPISSLHLSEHSPTLLVSTANSSQVHLLSLVSLLPTRIISPPPSSTPYGGLTFLTTFLYQVPSSSSGSTRTGGGGGEAATTLGVQREIATTLGRSVVGVEERERGGRGGRTVWGRVQESGQIDVEDLIQPAKSLASVFDASVGGHDAAPSALSSGALGSGAGGERETIERLERELDAYRRGLDTARGVNDRIWKSVVEGTLVGRGPAS